MIIYNVTTHVDSSIHDEWLEWMKQTHIPEMMQTGCFTKFQMVRMMEADETEGPTYATQYYAESKADYERYMAMNAMPLLKAGIDMWGDKTISFRSLMQIVH